MVNEYPSYDQQKQYYDARWANWVSHRRCADELCRINFIIRWVRRIYSNSSRTQKIIDLGCGSGWITNALSRYGNAVGVDFSVSIGRASYPNLKFIEANIITDKVEGIYDIVVSSEVIEHMTCGDQQLYVSKAAALLDNGGLLILTTPNKPIAQQLYKDISRDQLQPIENWLDKDTLSTLLDSYFKIKFIGTTMFSPSFTRRNKYFDFAFDLLHVRLIKSYKLVNRILSTNMSGRYLTAVAQKRDQQAASFSKP